MIVAQMALATVILSGGDRVVGERDARDQEHEEGDQGSCPGEEVRHRFPSDIRISARDQRRPHSTAPRSDRPGTMSQTLVLSKGKSW